MVLDFGQNAFIRSKTICLQQICVTNFNLNFPLTKFQIVWIPIEIYWILSGKNCCTTVKVSPPLIIKRLHCVYVAIAHDPLCFGGGFGLEQQAYKKY